MTVALILVIALVVVGGVLRLEQRLYEKKHPVSEESPSEQAVDAAKEGCCGMHITCERDSLLASVSTEIEYYEDEELDRFTGRGADGYSDSEIEEFRDVLLTLRTEEIAGWARSLQLRHIELPECVREELLMIVAEARANSIKPITA